MRAWLLVCAALALAPGQPPATAAHPSERDQLDQLDHIKTQILAKLGLSSRPTPQRAPPRDVVRKILQRAADPAPERAPEPERSMREIIAIAHRGSMQIATPAEGRNVRAKDVTYFKTCTIVRICVTVVFIFVFKIEIKMMPKCELRQKKKLLYPYRDHNLDPVST